MPLPRSCWAARPRGWSRTRLRDGFTLLEVLLTVALIALLGGSLISMGSQMLADKPVAPEDVFWQAVQESRKLALRREQEVRLRFDPDKKRFVVLDGARPAALAADGFTREELALKELAVPAPGSDLTVEFLAASKGGKAILVGGVMIETQPVPFVTFYPDGTCSPFRLQIMRQGGARILGVDPWTCAAVLNPSDENGR